MPAEALDRPPAPSAPPQTVEVALEILPGYEGFHPTVLCCFQRRLLERGAQFRTAQPVAAEWA
jgi:hypothetical protein